MFLTSLEKIMIIKAYWFSGFYSVQKKIFNKQYKNEMELKKVLRFTKKKQNDAFIKDAIDISLFLYFIRIINETNDLSK